MLTFKNLTDAENAVLSPLVVTGQPLAGAIVVVEDVEDSNAEINRALAEVGLMIFIGTPDFEAAKNNSGQTLTATVKQQILIGEVPAIWRVGQPNNPTPVHCQDAARIVAAALQGLLLNNNQRLRVLAGFPLGTFKGDNKTTIFQYYKLELETYMTFATS